MSTKYKLDQILLNNSIIHWSLPLVNKKVQVTCGLCKQQRYIQYPRGKLKISFTGYCLSCNNKLSARIANNHHNWKGGILFDKDGYKYVHRSLINFYEQNLFISMFNHSGYVFEHRLVMARKLNRPLTKQEIVHHLNEIKDDNRIENLVLTSISDHASEHSSILKAARLEIRRLQTLLKDYQPT